MGREGSYIHTSRIRASHTCLRSCQKAVLASRSRPLRMHSWPLTHSMALSLMVRRSRSTCGQRKRRRRATREAAEEEEASHQDFIFEWQEGQETLIQDCRKDQRSRSCTEGLGWWLV